MEFTLFGERVFPIYRIQAKWSEDIIDGKEYSENWIKDLPKGRFWNGTSTTLMLKDSLSHEEKETTLNEWWAQYSASEKFNNIADVDIQLEFVRFDSWNCVWFNHETFDYGQTDSEVIESFNKYIARVQAINEEYKHQKQNKFAEQICLMGAEDRYRWFSFNADDTENHDNPVCRCSGCKTAGKIRINH